MLRLERNGMAALALSGAVGSEFDPRQAHHPKFGIPPFPKYQLFPNESQLFPKSGKDWDRKGGVGGFRRLVGSLVDCLLDNPTAGVDCRLRVRRRTRGGEGGSRVGKSGRSLAGLAARPAAPAYDVGLRDERCLADLNAPDPTAAHPVKEARVAQPEDGHALLLREVVRGDVEDEAPRVQERAVTRLALAQTEAVPPQ